MPTNGSCMDNIIRVDKVDDVDQEIMPDQIREVCIRIVAAATIC